VVIGAGPGGYVAAIRAAQLGKKVACVDRRDKPGGTCLNIGCIPSKALLDSSELYAQAGHRFADHGIRAGRLEIDLKKMMQRKDRVVKGLTDGVAFLLKKNGVAWFQCHAQISGANKVILNRPGAADQILDTAAILVATGSEPASLPTVPFDGKQIISSTEALALDSVPKQLIVIGGGYIGLEIGSVWARLGSKVTVLEFLPSIVSQADREIGKFLQRALVKQGLEFHLETEVVGASVKSGVVEVQAKEKGEAKVFRGDCVLVAVGRRPHHDGLGLKEVGVAFEARAGRITVDENFQTSVPGIYAIGDVISGPMLAHKAQEEGIACVERLLGMKTEVNYQAIPSVVYTWPELASVGLTEHQVKTAGREYRVGKFPFTANGRARCMDDTEGLVKIIAEVRSDRILGVHILGPRASDLIAEAVALIEFAASAEDLARICHAHPTLSEAVREAALAVDHRAIHS
jgi:dihydrolipoamide dehydrogenase